MGELCESGCVTGVYKGVGLLRHANHLLQRGSPKYCNEVGAHFPAVVPLFKGCVHVWARPTIGAVLDDCLRSMVVQDALGTVVVAQTAAMCNLVDAVFAETAVDAFLAPEATLAAIGIRLSGTPHVLTCHIGGLPVG